MNRSLLCIAISATALMSSGAFAAGPPFGVPMGPPPFVTMGPPPGVTMGPPPGVTMGPPPGVTMGPPPGVTAGPPPGVNMGPPAAALAHIPAGVPLGKPTNLPVDGNSVGSAVSASARTNAALNGGAAESVEANAASELGKLNATHASPTAFDHANPNSAVGEIATYEDQMNAAMGLDDPAAKSAAITAARQQLALSSNKQLTSSAISKIDGMLGITGADPTLGTAP